MGPLAAQTIEKTLHLLRARGQLTAAGALQAGKAARLLPQHPPGEGLEEELVHALQPQLAGPGQGGGVAGDAGAVEGLRPAEALAAGTGQERGLAEARKGMQRQAQQRRIAHQGRRQIRRQTAGQQPPQGRRLQRPGPEAGQAPQGRMVAVDVGVEGGQAAGAGQQRRHRVVQAGAGLEHGVAGAGRSHPYPGRDGKGRITA